MCLQHVHINFASETRPKRPLKSSLQITKEYYWLLLNLSSQIFVHLFCLVFCCCFKGFFCFRNFSVSGQVLKKTRMEGMEVTRESYLPYYLSFNICRSQKYYRTSTSLNEWMKLHHLLYTGHQIRQHKDTRNQKPTNFMSKHMTRTQSQKPSPIFPPCIHSI